ncbi:DUF2007 domain-containing protein [Flavobacterium sp. 3HN19-14]|uniref:DUF2007 domain-containing protein n=1 Tax=Flavobacterium sp. 3HN19-14 TaxID=3448133 RepID=UPI003EE0EFA3
MGNDVFKKVATFQYSSEAFIVKGKLETAGIDVFMFDNHTIDTDPMISNAIGGVKLLVKTADYEKAVAELGDISRYSIDDDGKLMICPNCGSDKIDLLSTIKDVKSFLSFVFSAIITVALPFYTKYKYKCDNCGFEFSEK